MAENTYLFVPKKGTQSAYNALATTQKPDNYLFICTDSGNIYLGQNLIFEANSFINASLSDKTITFTTHGTNGTNSSKTLSLSSFATTSEVTSAISTAVSSMLKYKGSKATYADLPTSGNQTGDTWNVVAAYNKYPAGTNYAWNGTAWDALGGAVDLSVYYTKTETNTELAKKVDKVSGKGLSTNDYTTDEKTKLSGIASGATKVSVTQSLSSGVTIGSISVNDSATTLYAPEVNNGILTLKRNGVRLGSFYANDSDDLTVDIEVPTGSAASKGVDTSITANTTSTNLPTSAAVEARINAHSGIDKVGTITEIKMNGASKGTSGSVDLGTVVTDVSGKADKSSTVTNVSYNTTSKKIQKTINGTTSDVVTLATVATSGSYSDLSNKPSIPSELEWGTF